MHHDGVFVSADNARDFISQRDRHVPPAFRPRTHTARRPRLGIIMQTVVRLTRHRAQAVRDQVDSLVQNREFRTPLEKIVSQGSLLCKGPVNLSYIAPLALPPDAMKAFRPSHRFAISWAMPSGGEAPTRLYFAALRAFASLREIKCHAEAQSCQDTQRRM